MTPVLLAWQASSLSGWGLVGLNVFFHWSVSGDIQPLAGSPIGPDELAFVDPLRRHRIQASVAQSNKTGEMLQARMLAANGRLKLDFPVVHALGNGFRTVTAELRGSNNVGRIVFENTDTQIAAKQWAHEYDRLVCISEWNASLLKQWCTTDVVVTHEGIDPSVFFPAPRSGLMNPDNFYIFSGGKIEYRKGQDIVLLAFREFSEKHPDAMLVTSWQNPWPEVARGFKGRLEAPVEIGADGRLQIRKWASDNGIDPERVIDIGLISNQLMPAVLREMDCAIFPSRCEGGTNLVGMEAMACRVPVVFANNTGVRDIIDDGNCIALKRQSPVPRSEGSGTEDWGESDVEELVDALERLYASPTLREKIGARGAGYMATRTWRTHSAMLRDVVLDR